MIASIALRLYRFIVRAARFDAADLRTAHAEATFERVCAAAASHGRIALTATAARELLVIAGVIAAAYGSRMPRPPLPRPGDSLRNVRRAARTLLRSHRSYFVMSTGVVGLAVGVNLVVFTVVNALWLRPLPFADSERLVTLPGAAFSGLDKLRQAFGEGAVAGQGITDDRFESQSLEPRIRFDSVARDLETIAVTPDYFPLFGLTIRGRDFTPDDDRRGAELVAIMSDRLWSREFGRRTDVIGAVVAARPISLRIIGVAPPGFEGARRGERIDLWIPTNAVARVVPMKTHSSPVLMAYARLPRGKTVADAERHVRELMSDVSQVPGFDEMTRVVPLKDVFGTPTSRTIVVREGNAVAIVAGLALLVLLGGCATLAALVLVHSERRRGEVAVKIALGASRTRLIADRSHELGWVAVSGTAAAILIAYLGLRSIPSLSLPGGVDLGRLDLSIDRRVLAAAITTTVGILFAAAWLPIVRFTRPRQAMELCAGPATTPSAASHRVRQTLLALQVCATIVVLISAGLFVRAVIHGFGAGPGFDVDRTVFVDVQMFSSFADRVVDWRQRAVEQRTQIADAIRSLPGVEAVADGELPIGPDQARLLERPIVMKVNDRQYTVALGRLNGGEDLLSALGVPIVAGREVTETDEKVKPVPAVVTASLARTLWPEGNPIGQTVWSSLRDGKYQIVGIAPDFVFGSQARPAAGTLVTTRRLQGPSAGFVVRTAGPPSAIVRAIHERVKATAPDVTWISLTTGRDVVAADLGRQRLGAWFFSGFGVAALLLGVGGAFGLVAYMAESRQREFGVRLALGATIAELIRQGLFAALVPVAAGVLAGLIVAGVVSRVFAALLAGISALDGATYVAVALGMLGCAALAALTAAWRLRRMSPADVLRTT